MRVGIDFRIADGKPCGMARYTTNLVRGLSRLDQKNEYLLFSHFPDQRRALGLPDNYRWVHLPTRLFSVQEQMQLPGVLASHRLDVFHSLSFSMPLLRDCRSIMTIYDLIHLVYPQEDSAKVALYYKTIVQWCLRNVDAVVTISESSREDIERALRVPSEKISVIYGASDEVFRPLAREEAMAGLAAQGISGPFLLYVGNMRTHKNIAALVEALAALAPAHPDLKLVICGEKNYSYKDLLQKIDARQLSSKVLFLEGITDEVLHRLYAAAEALVLPSFYEGFGLPPLEAMSCGTPVIVADTAALKEIAGEGALSFHPRDVPGLTHHLERILSEEGLRAELAVRSSERAKKFSWDHAAVQALEIYEKLGRANGSGVLMDRTWKEAWGKDIAQVVAWREKQLNAFDLDAIPKGGVGVLPLHSPEEKPGVSVIIPTLDGDRDGNLRALLKDLCKQRFGGFELLLVKGVTPQGMAINMGAREAKADMLVILDDDSRAPRADTFHKLCTVFEEVEKVGMAGASVVVAPGSNAFQKRAARQFPRFNMPIVGGVTESDMASHGCCAIPKDLFYRIGRENENILRGLDPDLRERIRHAGYKTVLVPNAWVYHPLSPTMRRLMKQFYRNGVGSAQAWLADPKTVFQTHEKASIEGFVPRRSFGYRVLRFPLRLLHALLTLRVIRCIAYTGYAAGFLYGLAKYSLNREL